MQANPAIRANRMAPPSASPRLAPMKNPTIAAMTMTITDTTVLNLFIARLPPNLNYPMGSKSAAPCLHRGHTMSSGRVSPS